MFNECEICGASEWIDVIYEGPIRDGVFNSYVDKGTILRCGCCGVGRLDEKYCVSSDVYESDKYRKDMGQGLDVEDFFANGDPNQIQNLSAFPFYSFRDKVIADIGCGGGSFLDFTSGLTRNVVSIEPTVRYHDSLRQKGYQVYSYVSDAVKDYFESVDVAVTFQVIEHVDNPLQFIKEISNLLRPGGVLIIGTPNRNDILLKLLPKDFPKFFYRRVHRWYFDSKSLQHCVNLAGLKVEAERFSHGYGLANAMHWLRDRSPSGRTPISGINQAADLMWSSYLESTGQSDNIFIFCKK